MNHGITSGFAGGACALAVSMLILGCDVGTTATTSNATTPVVAASAVPPAEPTTSPATQPAEVSDMNSIEKIVKSDAEWRRSLTPEQYRVLREKGTERACSGEF